MLYFSSGCTAVAHESPVEILSPATNPLSWVWPEPANSNFKHVPLPFDGVVVSWLKMGNDAKSNVCSELDWMARLLVCLSVKPSLPTKINHVCQQDLTAVNECWLALIMLISFASWWSGPDAATCIFCLGCLFLGSLCLFKSVIYPLNVGRYRLLSLLGLFSISSWPEITLWHVDSLSAETSAC